MKFSDQDKEVKEFSDRLPFGVHKVQLSMAVCDKNDNGKEFIELHVVNDKGVEDSAKVWFVGGAANISFNTLRQIVVHNAKTEEDKAKAREAVDAVADTDALVELLNSKTVGGELWFTKYYDPERTYTNQAGVTKRSVNVNVYGYEPKHRPELMPEKSGADLFHDAVVNAMPGSKEVPFSSPTDALGSTVASNTVPDKDAWSN